MADSAVAGLTASGALTGTELFYADNLSADVKVTANQIKTFTGDVHGPASSIDNAIPRFDGTTGKVIQGGTGITVDDDGVALVAQMLMVGTTPPAQPVAPSAGGTHWPLMVDYTYTNAQMEGSIFDFSGGIISSVRGHKTSGSMGQINAIIGNIDIESDAGATVRSAQSCHLTTYAHGDGTVNLVNGFTIEATIELDDTIGEMNGYAAAMEIYVNVNTTSKCDFVWAFVAQAFHDAACTVTDFVAALFTNVTGVGCAVTNNIVIDISNGMAGPTADSKGIRLQTPGGGGAVTNHSGLWIGDQSGFGSTTSYNINSKGDNSKNVFDGFIVSTPKTVTALGSAATAGEGAKAFVTDSTVAASGNFGAVVAGGSTNNVPVFSDGTNWRIG